MSCNPRDRESSAGGFRLTALGELRILDRLGEGGRSVVYRAERRGRQVAVKIYKAPAVARHARKYGQELARFEYERNLAFYSAPGLSRYVARPLGYLHTSGLSALIQEKLDGELYYFHHRSSGGRAAPGLFRHVQHLVELSHDAGLYDADLHPMNVMVVRDPDGELVPKLFDFNLYPFHERNVWVRLLVALGLVSRRARDLRLLRNFHNFDRVESRLLPFYR